MYSSIFHQETTTSFTHLPLVRLWLRGNAPIKLNEVKFKFSFFSAMYVWNKTCTIIWSHSHICVVFSQRLKYDGPSAPLCRLFIGLPSAMCCGTHDWSRARLHFVDCHCPRHAAADAHVFQWSTWAQTRQTSHNGSCYGNYVRRPHTRHTIAAQPCRLLYLVWMPPYS